MPTIIEKCYIFDLDEIEGSALDLSLNIICERIPCFMTRRPLEELESIFVPYNEWHNMEVTINCREEDVRFVETMLAPFV